MRNKKRNVSKMLFVLVLLCMIVNVNIFSLTAEENIDIFLNALHSGAIDKLENITSSVDNSFYEIIIKEKALSEENFDYDFNKTKDGVVITGYRGDKNDVIIPLEIEGYPVLEIGDKAFYHKSNIELIILPPSIQHIGKESFSNMYNIKALIIPNSVKTIGEAFCRHSDNLCFVKLSNLLTSISKSAFYGCPNLEKIQMGNLIQRIESFAFCETSIDSILLPESLKEIGDRAFQKCSWLENINLGNAFERIGEGAFWESGLRKINFPSSLKEIGFAAFYNCKNLRDIIISSDLKKINFVREKNMLFPNTKYNEVASLAFLSCGIIKLSARKRLDELGYKDEF